MKVLVEAATTFLKELNSSVGNELHDKDLVEENERAKREAFVNLNTACGHLRELFVCSQASVTAFETALAVCTAPSFTPGVTCDIGTSAEETVGLQVSLEEL